MITILQHQKRPTMALSTACKRFPRHAQPKAKEKISFAPYLVFGALKKTFYSHYFGDSFLYFTFPYVPYGSLSMLFSQISTPHKFGSQCRKITIIAAFYYSCYKRSFLYCQYGPFFKFYRTPINCYQIVMATTFYF